MKFFSIEKNVSASTWMAIQLTNTFEMRGKHAFALRFDHIQHYLPDQPVIELLALVHMDVSADFPVIHLSICPFNTVILPDIDVLSGDLSSIRQFISCNQFPIFEVSAPWRLDPVFIPKPWGQEIWFTGIESRGQARIKADGCSVPLPWVLELFPQADAHELMLLKVLDPLPDEVYGDLYFELHEEKQEVYVVTHVDNHAWPGGIGAIQLGFSAEKKREYADEIQFKAAYLKAVKDYESVRRELDKRMDHINSVRADDTYQLKNQIKLLSQPLENKELIEDEKRLRKDMNSFVNHLPLAVGDTIAVPRRVPHALQHGVRVVEFQTPVYERKILSFAQKVLTQNHWDTEFALGIADFSCTSSIAPEVLCDTREIKIEQVVSFDDFQVQRIYLDSSTYKPVQTTYSLLMPIAGELAIEWGLRRELVKTGEAVLLPAFLRQQYAFLATNESLFLHALPV